MKKIIFVICFTLISSGVKAAELHENTDFSRQLFSAEQSDITTSQNEKRNNANINNTNSKADYTVTQKLSKKQKKQMQKLKKKEEHLKALERKRQEKEYFEKIDHEIKMAKIQAKKDKINKKALAKQKKKDEKSQKKQQKLQIKEDIKNLKEYEKLQKVKDFTEKEQHQNLENTLTAEPWQNNKSTIDIHETGIQKQSKTIQNEEAKQLESIKNSIFKAAEVKNEPQKQNESIKPSKENDAELLSSFEKLSKSDCRKLLKNQGIKFDKKSFLAEAEKNNTQNTAYFLKAGMPPDVGADSETTPLIWACYNENMQMIKLLIQYGAKVNWANKDGFTPLMAAVEKSNIKIIKYLLQQKAKVNVTTFADKTTPLHIAAYNGNKDALELLVVAGANVNAENSGGITPLTMALMYGNNEAVEYLKSQGADIGGNVNRKKIVLGVISNNNSSNTASLINLGIDVNLADNNGKTLLHTAVINRDYESVKLLLENGASTDLTMKNKYDTKLTPLHLAVISNDPKTVNLLLEHGAYTEVKNGNLGATPLHLSVLSNNRVMTNTLVEHGADINALTNGGVTPSDIALAVKNKDILSELILNGGLFGKDTGAKLVKYGCSVVYNEERDLYEINPDEALKAVEKYESDNKEMNEYKKYMDRTHKFRTQRKEFAADKHAFNIYPLLYGRI